MSMMKRWLEEHIDNFTDEELLNMGYSKQEIEDMRKAWSNK